MIPDVRAPKPDGSSRCQLRTIAVLTRSVWKYVVMVMALAAIVLLADTTSRMRTMTAAATGRGVTTVKILALQAMEVLACYADHSDAAAVDHDVVHAEGGDDVDDLAACDQHHHCRRQALLSSSSTTTATTAASAAAPAPAPPLLLLLFFLPLSACKLGE